MSEYQLAQQIIAQSEASSWDEARLEWELVETRREEQATTCLCGHFPILWACVLQNTKNGNEVIVGNCCVTKFTGIEVDKIAQAVERVKRDIGGALNPDVIQLAHQKRWISVGDRRFYLDTWRKRKLSPKQLSWRKDINCRVLRHLSGRRVRRQ